MLVSIPGFQNYTIDAEGQVYIRKSGKRRQPAKDNPNIYLLRTEGRYVSRTRAELLALAFCGPRPARSVLIVDGAPTACSVWWVAVPETRPIQGFANHHAGADGYVYRDGGSERWSRLEGSAVPPMGYLSVGLASGARRWVHRLICAAWHGSEPSPGMHAAHYDGDPKNNRPTNLRWATPKENAEDKFRHATIPCGSKVKHALIDEATALDVAARLRSGAKPTEVSRSLDIPRHIVVNIKRGHSWSHVTGLHPQP